jgi:hypothetical protein
MIRWSLDDRKSAADTIRRLGEDDLLYLNRLIIERLHLLSQARSTVLMSRFNTGDRVAFQTPSGEHKRGVVLRLHKKTVAVQTDDGHRWNVSPAFLSPADLPERR